MNFITKLISILAIFTLVFSSSCRNGKKNPPLISISETQMYVLPNDTVNVEVTFERGDRKINTLSIKGIGDEIIIDEIDNKNVNTYTYQAIVPTNAAKSTIIVTFTAADTRKYETTVELELIVETPFEYERIGAIISNAQGPSTSAWNLVKDEGLFFNDPNINKDIADNTSAGSGAFLKGGWTTGNATRFVVDSVFNYAKASVENATLAYENGEPKATLLNNDLAVGNVIIAKIRGGEEFAVIEITDVFDDGVDGGTGNNADYRKFNYKK